MKHLPLILLACASLAHADAYKCLDEKGKSVFSSEPCRVKTVSQAKSLSPEATRTMELENERRQAVRDVEAAKRRQERQADREVEQESLRQQEAAKPQVIVVERPARSRVTIPEPQRPMNCHPNGIGGMICN